MKNTNEKEIQEKKRRRKWRMYHFLELISSFTGDCEEFQRRKFAIEQMSQIAEVKEIDSVQESTVNDNRNTTKTNNSIFDFDNK